MRIIRNILLIALALLLQSTLFGRLDIYDIRPDFAMLVLIFLVNETSTARSILYGFFIGFIQDVYTPEYLGYNTFTMSLIAFLLGMVKERLTVENYTIKLFVTLVACMVHDAVYLLFYTQFDLSILGPLFIKQSIPGAVYTSVLAVVIVRAWGWVQKGELVIVVRDLLGIRR